MNKRQYLIEALQSGAYKRMEWIISAFTITRHDPTVERERYPYQLVRGETGDRKQYFLDPNNGMEPTEIEESHVGEPLYTFKDRITLKPGDLPNVKEEVETRVGNALFNCITLIYAFGDKVPFATGKIKAGALEMYIAKRLRDTPVSEEDRKHDPEILYVDEYVRFCEGLSSLAGLTQISTPSGTEKSMSVDPAIIKRRDELLEQYKDQLHDPAIISKIEQELVAMDRASFADDPAGDFYAIGKKAYDVNRKRAFIMFGIETGFGDTSRGVNLIRPSLKEGVDMNNMPGWVDSVRAGSYNRGHETALGGESVKYFYRIFQNTKVAEEDCGTMEGLTWAVSEDNYKSFVGLHLAGVTVKTTDPVAKAEATRLTEATLKGMIGKKIKIRSPMLCKTAAPSFCARCVGDGFAANPTGLHIAISDVGSNFMYAFMQAVHGKALKTARYRFKHSIT